MGDVTRMDRRGFVQWGIATSGGLWLGVHIGGPREASAAAGRVDGFQPSVWVRIDRRGEVEILAPVPEIGQGVRTSLPMIVASELAVPWAAVRVRQADAGRGMGSMSAAGSNSVADYHAALRRAGAAARMMLTSAAARRWGIDAARCRAEQGVVIAEDGRRAAYGSLVDEAAALPVPTDIVMLPTAERTIVGRATPGVDLPDIVTGSATFGIDVRLPDMRFAVIARSPSEQGRLRSMDDAAARAVPGVTDVVRVEHWVGTHPFKGYGIVLPGVAVVATTTWAAIKGRDALRLVWESEVLPSADDRIISDRFEAALDEPGSVLRVEGDVDGAFLTAATTLEASYQLPMLAHACMEPMNFTVDVRSDGCLATGPVQNPILLQTILAELLSLESERVTVRPTLIGGGFGRRLSVDYGVEAAVLSRAMGRPIQVVWTREDDMRHDHFRPPAHHRMRAALSESGQVIAWDHHLACAGLQRQLQGPPIEDRPALYDVQGAAEVPLNVPSIRIRYSAVDVPQRLGSWRSVAHSHNVFAVSSFLDEIAHEREIDPLELHRELLSPARRVEVPLPLPGSRGLVSADTALLLRVLDAAAAAAAWGSASEPGHGRGIAWSFYKQSYAAHVAEVRVVDGRVRVERIVTAVDCGEVVNPDGVVAQAEGGAMDAVGAVFWWGVRLTAGRVEQLNFDRHRLPRMADAPPIEVHILSSERPPSGAGEVTHPAVIPAITNAIFAATGRRIRRLPIDG